MRLRGGWLMERKEERQGWRWEVEVEVRALRVVGLRLEGRKWFVGAFVGPCI
jgi:hypothetical protein